MTNAGPGQILLRLEPAKGSTFVLVTSLAASVVIQFVTVMLLTLAGILLSSMLFFLHGGGFWPLAFVFIALESQASVDATRQ